MRDQDHYNLKLSSLHHLTLIDNLLAGDDCELVMNINMQMSRVFRLLGDRYSKLHKFRD